MRETPAASEPALREPAIDLVEVVDAPEWLAVDEDEGRAEDALGNRRLDFAAQRILHHGVVDGGARGGTIEARLAYDVGCHLRITDVAVVHEIRAVERVHEA